MLLECAGVIKRYGGLVAVDRVNLQVHEGEILGIIGPNGSGKSTFVDLLSGVTPLSDGRISFADHDVTRMQSWKVARLGMARTFQMLRLFPQLTIRANMVMAECWRMRSGYLGSAMGSRKAKFEEAELSHRAEVLLGEFDMAEFADRFPGELSIGQQRLVEIARSLMGSPRLLLLDEPAAGLSPPNVDRLIQHIHDIRNKRGTSIILVEHVMKVVMAACDRVAVLDQGSKIADGLPAEIVKNPAVISAYLGVEKESPDA